MFVPAPEPSDSGATQTLGLRDANEAMLKLMLGAAKLDPVPGPACLSAWRWNARSAISFWRDNLLGAFRGAEFAQPLGPLSVPGWSAALETGEKDMAVWLTGPRGSDM